MRKRRESLHSDFCKPEWLWLPVGRAACRRSASLVESPRMRSGHYPSARVIWSGIAVCAALLHVADPARADPAHADARSRATVELFPTVVAALDPECPAPAPPDAVSPPPDAVSPPAVAEAARRVDEALAEAARDLGLTPTEGRSEGNTPRDPNDLRGDSTADWVLKPQLTLRGQSIELALTAAPPGTDVVFVRRQVVTLDALELRATVMLRDLLDAAPQSRSPSREPTPNQLPVTPESPAPVIRSAGRAQLALNAGVFGGYVGWTLQRTSGSSDARLTYPLVAVGAAAGLGASMVVADEWDVDVGEAWYVSAGMWWPLSSAIMLSDAYHVTPSENRFAYGLLGATAGTALATASAALADVDQGGALLAHSGGAFGSILGGITQLIKRGSTEKLPTRGAGYGALAGVVTAGVIATQAQIEASRVLFIDLSASLGGLVGAAAASPLLLVDEEEEAWRTRTWLAATGGGILAGGVVGLLLTDGEPTLAASQRQPVRVWPSLGLVDIVSGPKGSPVPAYGAGFQGAW